MSEAAAAAAPDEESIDETPLARTMRSIDEHEARVSFTDSMIAIVEETEKFNKRELQRNVVEI